MKQKWLFSFCTQIESGNKPFHNDPDHRDAAVGTGDLDVAPLLLPCRWVGSRSCGPLRPLGYVCNCVEQSHDFLLLLFGNQKIKIDPNWDLGWLNNILGILLVKDFKKFSYISLQRDSVASPMSVVGTKLLYIWNKNSIGVRLFHMLKLNKTSSYGGVSSLLF